ncbi:unnamed protein product [Polarella glacialis]|uniref:Large ribosomal subunit protein uL15/eL18 domain-containing protein n=1 Tax=Polarella glacialis TaxID=89957 RepID=A0A813FVQ7_POLGL|nr:unnamed protein product [Polarella glacialis]
MSGRNKPPLSLSKLGKFMANKEGKIAVVVGTVTDDKRMYEVPKLTVCALRFTETATTTTKQQQQQQQQNSNNNNTNNTNNTNNNKNNNNNKNKETARARILKAGGECLGCSLCFYYSFIVVVFAVLCCCFFVLFILFIF